MGDKLNNFHQWAANWLAPDPNSSTSTSSTTTSSSSTTGGDDGKTTYEKWHDWAANILAPPSPEKQSGQLDTPQYDESTGNPILNANDFMSSSQQQQQQQPAFAYASQNSSTANPSDPPPTVVPMFNPASSGPLQQPQFTATTIPSSVLLNQSQGQQQQQQPPQQQQQPQPVQPVQPAQTTPSNPQYPPPPTSTSSTTIAPLSPPSFAQVLASSPQQQPHQQGGTFTTSISNEKSQGTNATSQQTMHEGVKPSTLIHSSAPPLPTFSASPPQTSEPPTTASTTANASQRVVSPTAVRALSPLARTLAPEAQQSPSQQQ